ncbi:MAG TPA: tRNA epoxyqueuosine(34) reductase QueG [Acidobacteriaceae bacterium]|nr:tRNA epoxyqueuosine(34) reductase QueG [Acidobacteriaceae bacterium]
MALTRIDCEWIAGRTRAAGFDLAGIAPVPQARSAEVGEIDHRFGGWIAAGHAGEMEWLKRTDEAGELVRGDLRRAIPWARSVVVCAFNYNADAPRSVDDAPGDRGWIARYAWSGRRSEAQEQVRGADYHDVLLPKLRVIEAELLERFGPACEIRCYVDTGPVLEREYARKAGLGWIGKNTCVLNQELGSWLLLGVMVTSLELAGEAGTVAAADRCGSCTRCIDACPTDALIAPRVMDASRCISYLTIEKKGAIEEEIRPLMGRQVFGCDICQDVCPWNRKAPVTPAAQQQLRKELVNPSLAWLGSMDGPEFNRWFRGSPLERTRRKRVQRNVAIAMGNSGEEAFLPQLREWASGEDVVLADAAKWAIEQLRKNGARDRVADPNLVSR